MSQDDQVAQYALFAIDGDDPALVMDAPVPVADEGSEAATDRPIEPALSDATSAGDSTGHAVPTPGAVGQASDENPTAEVAATDTAQHIATDAATSSANSAPHAAQTGAPAEAVQPATNTASVHAADATEPATQLATRKALPIGSAADAHAIIATATACYTPSGRRLAGPIDSIDKLGKLIDWAQTNRMLGPKGGAAQIWLMGMDACALLGWEVDLAEIGGATHQEQRDSATELLNRTITGTLAPLIAEGWELRGRAGHRVHLKMDGGPRTRMVDIILEPYAWTISRRPNDYGILGAEEGPTMLPDDDMAAAAEVSRRIAWCVEHLGVLPGNTAARTGASIADSIKRSRKKTGRGAIATSAGAVPPIADLVGEEIEPVVLWARLPEPVELEGVTHLVTIDQRASYLASAGMADLGYGNAEFVPYAADQAREAKRPFGLWQVTIPARASLSLPANLPAPHPHMQDSVAVTTWVTTVSLDGLTAPIASGGAGLDIDDLEIGQAWLWPQQGRLLDAWTKRLREARTVAVTTGDRAMKAYVGAIYKGYIGRMRDAKLWGNDSMLHHHQPVWRATIMAMSRWRGRRVATEIAAKTGRWPLMTATDSWVYALADGDVVADPTEMLGKMATEKDTALTGPAIAALLAADNRDAMRHTLADIHAGKIGDVQ